MYANSQAKGDRRQDPALSAIADRFRALSDPVRLRLLDLLRDGERGAGELARASGASPANVSHHLALLRRLGLVACERRGRDVVYRLADPCVAALCDRVCESLARRQARALRQGRAMWGRRPTPRPG